MKDTFRKLKKTPDFDPNLPTIQQGLLHLLLECSEKKDFSEWNDRRRAEPFTPIYLQCIDLSSRYFEKVNLDHAHLEGCKLRGANLKKASLINVFFNSCDMAEADMSGANLLGAHLDNVNLCNAKLMSIGNTYEGWCNLVEATIKNSNLYEADLSGAKLIDCYLNDSDFTNATLKNTVFRACVVDAQTKFYCCKVNKNTDFSLVGLESARVSPELMPILKTNIRRIKWKSYCKEISPLIAFFIHSFWWISDYGSSTSRVLKSFFCATLFFCILYALTGSLAHNVLSGIAIPNAVPLSTFIIELLRCFCFALSTMVTLGFGEININPEYAHKGWQAFALITVTLNLLVGYFLLAVLVTRLGILFQSLAPEQKMEDD